MIGILRAVGALIFDRESRSEPEMANGESEGVAPTLCTVLAIDDDPTILNILRPVLREEGFNVLESTSAPQGMDMSRYAGSHIHIALLDYNMPQLHVAA